MFKNIKVGTKLIAAFLCLSVLGAIVAGIGIINMGRINDMADRLYARDLIGVSYIKEANINLIYAGRARGNFLLSTTEQERQAHLASVHKYLAAFHEYMEKARPLIIAPRAKELLAQYGNVAASYEKEMQAALSLAEKEKLQQRSEELNKALAETRKYADTLDGMLTEIVQLKEGVAKATAEETSQLYQSSKTFMLLLTACSALAGLALGVLITRNLTRQLGGEPRYAVDVASRIASGDLNVVIETRPNDHSSLLHAMQQMRDSLANIVSQVLNGTATIASASAEVAAGSQDLSSRTEQQASALEETASSMEELTSTVKQNADNARQANALAGSASEVAVKGGAVVSQVIDTMDSINESSKKIVDIISVIDGIAFQTNILALNAAVEAARAGEQGRGFAVVASEVRTLAQRSAAAAKEIKFLIGDSVEKVEAGSKLVDQAGETMQEIVSSVRRVTDIMGEITAASQEQTSGIEQINQAISQMDEVTQQNAALVEEAAAASMAMQDQSANLAQVVSVFKLDQARNPSAAGSAPAARAAAAAPALSGRSVNPGVPSVHSPRHAAPQRIARPSILSNEEWDEF